MNPIEQIITRANELKLAMGVRDGRLLLEGNMRLLSGAERENITRHKAELIAYLTAPREHVAIMCKHRQADGRACGEIVTLQRPCGKVAWCQNCYDYPVTENKEPCYCCGSTDWWYSIHGQRICRVCHPPAHPELEDKDANHQIIQPQEAGLSVVSNVPHVVLPLRTPESAHKETGSVMYVSSDLDYWIADESYLWADKVNIQGKQYVKLTPVAIAWFKQQIATAEEECNAGKLSVDDLTKIIRSFCPVYEFAVRTGIIPDPVPASARKSAESGII